MLDNAIIQQVREIFRQLEASFVFKVSAMPGTKDGDALLEFLADFASTSDHLAVERDEAEADKLEFALVKGGTPTGVVFRGIPNGHEFSSLILVVLNADGKGKNLPDDGIVRRIRSLRGGLSLRTYVSLTCTNCPDVVQALNVVALFNPGVSHEMVDGALFQEEVGTLAIQAVPAVYADGELLHVGRGSLGELLAKLEERYPAEAGEAALSDEVHGADVLVLGGGPAGAAAAIYSARKGLKVALVAERIGGQVRETVGIENLISVPETTGARLADDLRKHLGRYPIEVYENRTIEAVSLKEGIKRVVVKGGETFTAPAVIIATGAGWRRLNVEGEADYIGRGVAFCPHCDGPFYAGRDVAVVGGGNSGIEAAIDLAGICRKVTVLEFMDRLKADQVLQDKVRSLPNVEVLTSRQTLSVEGDGKGVTALNVRDRATGQDARLPVSGVFVKRGLRANSKPFHAELEVSGNGEIPIDDHCRTAIAGVYAAGDVSTVPYKQIMVAMGEGAKAALAAFDDRVRGLLATE